MPDLHTISKQSLINLQKVMDLNYADDAAYEDEKGVIKSMYQRQETGFRLEIDGKVHFWIFNKHNKLVCHTVKDAGVI